MKYITIIPIISGVISAILLNHTAWYFAQYFSTCQFCNPAIMYINFTSIFIGFAGFITGYIFVDNKLRNRQLITKNINGESKQ